MHTLWVRRWWTRTGGGQGTVLFKPPVAGRSIALVATESSVAHCFLQALLKSYSRRNRYTQRVCATSAVTSWYEPTAELPCTHRCAATPDAVAAPVTLISHESASLNDGVPFINRQSSRDHPEASTVQSTWRGYLAGFERGCAIFLPVHCYEHLCPRESVCCSWWLFDAAHSTSVTLALVNDPVGAACMSLFRDDCGHVGDSYRRHLSGRLSRYYLQIQRAKISLCKQSSSDSSSQRRRF